MGWRLVSIIRRQVRRFCGQPSIGPNGVADQSYSRIRCPISPPPVKNSGIAVFASIEVLKLKHPPQKEAALLERLFFFYGMMGLVLRFPLVLRIVHEDH